MNLTKQNIAVWVKADSEKPDHADFLPCRVNGFFYISCKYSIEAWGFYTMDNKFYEPKIIEWLKPVEGYLLTEEEINLSAKYEVLKGQIEIIQGYYNKIFMNKLSVSEILDLLEKDREYLQQEFNIQFIQSITK